MAGIISDLEIFATGTHSAQSGKISVTDDDLEQIINAFDSLKGSNIVKPHLKLGHTDAQKWFGQKDGIPTLGWITKVWRKGKKLLAEVTDVPDALIDLLKQGRFHNVSAEIFWDAPIEHEGRRFPRVLSAVSLLGVEMPAVKDLNGLASALFQDGPIHQFSETPAQTFSEHQQEISPMPGKDKEPGDALFSQEQLDNLVAAAVTKAVDEIKAQFKSEQEDSAKKLEVAEKRAADAEAEIAKVKLEASQAEAISLVDTAIKEGKLLPKQRDFALAFLSVKEPVKFGDGEEKPVTVLFKEFIEAQGKVVDLSESGHGDNKKQNFETAAQELDFRIKEFQREHKDTSYAIAFDAVLESDNDLRERYHAGQA